MVNVVQSFGIDRERVMEWELQHHKDSFKEAVPGSLAVAIGWKGFHNCRLFQEYSDETGRPTQIRIYNYDRLVEIQD